MTIDFVSELPQSLAECQKLVGGPRGGQTQPYGNISGPFTNNTCIENGSFYDATVAAHSGLSRRGQMEWRLALIRNLAHNPPYLDQPRSPAASTYCGARAESR